MFPVKSLHDYKFWPPVARVDNVFGDRNPVCFCVGMENYQQVPVSPKQAFDLATHRQNPCLGKALEAIS